MKLRPRYPAVRNRGRGGGSLAHTLSRDAFYKFLQYNPFNFFFTSSITSFTYLYLLTRLNVFFWSMTSIWNFFFTKEKKTNFLLYINDLPKNTSRSLINIYANYTTVYRCTSKYLDDQCQVADLSSLLTFTDQWGKDRLISFNKFKTKLVIHRHQTNPKLALTLMRLLVSNSY